MFAASAAEEHFQALLLCLVVILVLGRLVGIVFRAIKQPVVIGEILVGIALGPSLLGEISPSLRDKLFNAVDLPFYKLVASLGLVLFMFIVGMEVDLDVIRKSGKRAVTISLTSIALPFVLGFGVLGHYLYTNDNRCVAVEVERASDVGKVCDNPPADVQAKLDTRQKAIDVANNDPKHAKVVPKPLVAKEADFSPFAMFIGVSMCGTAFPVLARILAERNMFRIPLGLMLIACAAIDDIMAFTLLALSTAIAGQGSASDVILILVKLVIFTTILFAGVRPLLERFVLRPYRKTGRLAPEQLSILLAGLLICSYCTSKIGVHELIGAFLFGVAVPRKEAANLFHAIAERLEGVSVQLLLPVFFVIAGQGVDLGGLTRHDILPTIAILLIACIGKFVGGAGAARLCGVPRRQSLAIGTLMNTRGLAELVILQVGRDAGVIGDKLYTMLVIMAVVTTAMSGPLLKFVYPDKWLNRDIAEADRQRTDSATDRVVVVIDDIAAAQPLAETAAAYGGGRKTGSVTLLRLTEQGGGLAGFADELGEMKTLRETVEAAGLTCQVITRATSDRNADVFVEVGRLAPGAVVLGPSDAGLTAGLQDLGSDVIAIGGPLGEFAAVEVQGGNSNSDLAVVEMGVRLALHAGVPLIADHKLAGRTDKQMRQLGVDRIDSAPSSGRVLVVSTSLETAVTVHPGARDRVPLTEALGGWTATEPVILGSR